MKALLAASIAFTPLATVAVSPATSVQAEEYDSYSALAERLFNVYKTLGDADRATLLTIRTDVNTLLNNDTKLDSILSNITLDKVGGGQATTTEKRNVARAALAISMATSKEDLEAKVNAFVTNYNTDIQAVFGSSANDFLGYISQVELEMFDILKDKDVNNLVTLDYIAHLNTAMDRAATKKPAYPALSTKVKNAITANAGGILKAKADIQAAVDPSNQLKPILIKAYNNADKPGGGNGGNPGGGNSGGGGGGPVTPPPVEPKPEDPKPDPTNPGKIVTGPGAVESDPSKVVDAIKDAKDFKEVGIELTGDKVNIDVPSSIFDAAKGKNANATVNVKVGGAEYKLPVKEVNIADLAKNLGVDAKDVKIKITVAPAKDDNNVLGKNGLKSVAPIIEFKVEATAGNKTISLERFNSYVPRSITADKPFNANIVAAVVINDNGTVSARPLVVNGNVANIFTMTNSKYTIIENKKTFKDVTATHWNKAAIEKLGSKLIVQGFQDGTFKPESNTSRIQMAVLLTRALGLTSATKYDGRFTDVKGDEWFVPELMAAVEAGIIQGKGDNTFAPYQRVSRVQTAAMIHRALNRVGYDKDAAKKLPGNVADYKDEASIQEWARQDVEMLKKLGIMEGKPGNNFDPHGATSRAQIVKVVDESLQELNLINE